MAFKVPSVFCSLCKTLYKTLECRFTTDINVVKKTLL